MAQTPTIIPLAGHVFEYVIDGYFPLQESLRQMMERQGFCATIVCLNFAPAMDIPNLAPQDPVPLYVTDGFGCMIRRMTLVARHKDGKVEIEGYGDWNWFDGPSVDALEFSTLHRLAEPAFVKGVGFKAGGIDTKLLGQVEEGTSLSKFALWQVGENEDLMHEKALDLLGWQAARMIFGGFARKAIVRDEAMINLIHKINGPPAEFILLRDDEEHDENHSFMVSQHLRLLL